MQYFANKEITKTVKSYMIPVDLYKRNVEIIFSPQSEKLEKDWGKETAGVEAQTRNYINECGKVTISFYATSINISTAVHELAHATQMILFHAGHDHAQEEADEPFAYLLGYLVEEFFKLCKKQKVTLKKQ